MSASVCAACKNAPATKVNNEYLSRLCASCRKDCKSFVAKRRGIKSPVQSPKCDEYNAYIDSITESAASTHVQEAPIAAGVTAPSMGEDASRLSPEASTVGFSDDDTSKHIRALISDQTAAPLNDSSNNASEEEDVYTESAAEEDDTDDNIFSLEEEDASESNRSDTSDSESSDSHVSDIDNSVIENNGVEMNSSNDAPVKDSVEETMIVVTSTKDVSSKDDAVESISSDTSETDIEDSSKNDTQSTAPATKDDDTDAVHVVWSSSSSDEEIVESDDEYRDCHYQEQPEYGRVYDILFCDGLNTNRDSVATKTKKGKPFTKVHSYIRRFNQTVDSFNIVTCQDAREKLNLEPGTTVVFDDNDCYFKAFCCFCEWICKEPAITHCHYEADSLNQSIQNRVVDNVEPLEVAGYHPHMDFDIEPPQIARLKELGVSDVQYFNRIIDLCEQLGSALNSGYSIAGYTTSQAIHDVCDKLPLYPESASKVISLHVVFFDVVMSVDDMTSLFSSTFASKLIKEADGTSFKMPLQIVKIPTDNGDVEVPLYGIDQSIYELKKSDGSRKFRHYLSPKAVYIAPNEKKGEKGKTIIKYYPGAIINSTDDKPLDFTTQFIHPCGKEKRLTSADVIGSDRWLAIPNPEPDVKTTARKRSAEQKIDSKLTCNDIEWNGDEMIKMSNDELLELFDDAFPNHDHDELQKMCAFIGACPIDIDSATQLVQEWYDKNPDGHNNQGSVKAYMQYYRSDASNKWFWALMKHLPADRKDYYINTFAPVSIDKTRNVNNVNNTITNYEAINQAFGVNEIKDVLNMMRGMIGTTVDGRYFYKELHNGTPVLRECPEVQFNRVLRQFRPFKGNWNINLLQLFHKYTPLFMYESCQLYNPKNPAFDSDRVLNLFQGYKYQPIRDEKRGYDILKPFLDHIKSVICNGDAKRFDYFMKWWASTLKAPGTKQGVVMIVYGAGKGSGKTIVMDVMCETFGETALNNASIKDAFGEFNPHVDTHLLCIINETPNWEDGHVNCENFTRAVTEVDAIKNVKGVSQQKVKSFINYVIVSNEPNPIKEGFENRRTYYFHVNDEHVGDRAYFKNLMKGIQSVKKGPYDIKFMQTLMHYLLNAVNVDGFDAEDAVYDELMDFKSEHNEKLMRFDHAGKVLQEIVEHYEDYIDGITFEDITNNMCANPVSPTRLGNQLANYVTRKRVTVKTNENGKTVTSREWRYFLNKNPNLYSLIRYIHQDATDAQIAKLDEYFKGVRLVEPEQLDIKPADM